MKFRTVQCCFTSTEDAGTVRDWGPRTAISSFTQLLSSVYASVLLYDHRNQERIGDGEPRTATSTFTVLLYVHRNHQAYWGRGAQDGHLDFHTQLVNSRSVVEATVLIRLHALRS